MERAKIPPASAGHGEAESNNMAKTSEEKLLELREKQAQLKARENALIKREKENERKARTRRLIQNGALAEQYLRCENWEPARFETLLKLMANDDNFKQWLKEVRAAAQDTAAEG
jgi:hypothetical protein